MSTCVMTGRNNAEVIVIITTGNWLESLNRIHGFGPVIFDDKDTGLVVFNCKERFVSMFKMTRGLEYISHSIKKEIEK